MKLSIVAAMSENQVIGRDNRLPWHLPADLKHFKRITTGHTVIMGRKTFESMGKPLPNRSNIIITRNRTYRADGAVVAHSLDEAIAHAGSQGEVFIIGGEEIFREALRGADRMYLTTVHATVQGDAYFPPVNWDEWLLAEERHHDADKDDEFAMTFRRFERVRFGSGEGPV